MPISSTGRVANILTGLCVRSTGDSKKREEEATGGRKERPWAFIHILAGKANSQGTICKVTAEADAAQVLADRTIAHAARFTTRVATIRAQFLGILNVSRIEQARKLPSDKLIAANAYQVATKSRPSLSGDNSPTTQPIDGWTANCPPYDSSLRLLLNKMSLSPHEAALQGFETLLFSGIRPMELYRAVQLLRSTPATRGGAVSTALRVQHCFRQPH
ncbi:hypothetical protein N7519_007158 [Penicillium mononematosum]|uniref:uncharacterized protein n=1 Tax=Penicillium mononematosum TaxID=268346 RepID=UPI002548CECD|nr:uncharacterized protein N7519_007158 [Penicillium mononematosum]KAJ6185857.1 hypothetical protein N7519_007158 [Penicillium mononematosum]